MKLALALLSALALGACASAPAPEPAPLDFLSAQAGFTQIDMRVTETRRTEQASVLEFVDRNPDKGSKLTKGLFRLRSAATVAERRGYRYFVILNKSGDDDGLLIGLLPSQDADFAEVFGEAYAGVSRNGVLDAAKLGPLQLP